MYKRSEPKLYPEEIESYEGPDGIFYSVKEVCKVFEIEDVDQAVAELDPDEKQEIIVQADQGKAGGLKAKKILAVSYAGLLTLMLRSQTPLAKKVRRWISHCALPDLFSGQGWIEGYDGLPKEDLEQLGIAHWIWNQPRNKPGVSLPCISQNQQFITGPYSPSLTTIGGNMNNNQIKVSVFDFKKDWHLVEPHLNDPEVLDWLNLGMLAWSISYGPKHLPIWNPNDDIGPWQYSSGDGHVTYAVDRTNEDPEFGALDEK